MAAENYKQSQENAKLVMANVARAKNSLSRGDIPKAVENFMAGLAAKIKLTLAKSDANVIEARMIEFCDEFSGNYAVTSVLESLGLIERPYVKFLSGADLKILAKLETFRVKYAAAQEEQRLHQERKNAALLGELMSRGRELLTTGQSAKGRVMLKRAADQFGAQPGVLLDVGKLLYKAKYPRDAMEVLRRAMETFPREPGPYKYYIQACHALDRNEEIEEAYLTAVKVFGPHPKTYLNMSKFYAAWRKNDQAYDYAQRAYGMDQSLDEAKALMERFG